MSLIILKVDDKQFTLTSKKPLHITFKRERIQERKVREKRKGAPHSLAPHKIPDMFGLLYKSKEHSTPIMTDMAAKSATITTRTTSASTVVSVLPKTRKKTKRKISTANCTRQIKMNETINEMLNSGVAETNINDKGDEVQPLLQKFSLCCTSSAHQYHQV